MTADMLRAALAEHVNNQNMAAFLRVIRAGETSQDDGAYHTLVGNTRFESLDRHPRQMVWLPNLRVNSSAAGAYQFLGRTWDECVKALGLQDFGKASQDLAAVFLIRRRGALDDVIAGRFEAAIKKCAKEWASLPGSPYGQPVMTMAKAKSVYAQYGGFLNTSPPPVQETPKTEHVAKEAPVAPLIAMLGKTLISAFAPLAAEKIQREISRHTDRPEVAEQITDAVIGAAKAATGLEDPIEAVAEARKDPQVLAQVEASVLDKLASMAPLLQQLDNMDRQRFADEEGSRAAAHARNPSDWDMTPVLVFGALGLVACLVLLVGGIAIYQVVTGTIAPEVWAQLAGLIGFATGVCVTIFSFRFGTTRNNTAKDVLIRELATNGRTP